MKCYFQMSNLNEVTGTEQPRPGKDLACGACSVSLAAGEGGG